jgi:MYXO-CTERM domain-containing protein
MRRRLLTAALGAIVLLSGAMATPAFAIPVPEPSSASLLGPALVALIGLGWFVRRRKRT